ncbi:helix-turn-helix transcriptional regulator [Nodosilinea sp. LEGE 06152]|uniref:helix-turn-helix transcriptional regulator n=1 Tax=Nodosilinea sp. LEGE 06152 TaxID=2777966 RepID=UPI001880214B|nr:helix-turn-helix transcriptional regulator [Nodosilinea sp. LEGE 06152]MBE9158204.1 helix-turn-helix transcriptional regulator [Nodosilinea sp. LEGE 06152]MBE9160643.1 helix-turn-helix transcriptional regulator [Nodosilinea sp. LEGE 06152]
MGKAGKALKQVLEDYSISQFALAVAMDVERNNVYRWVNEKRDPTAETVIEIVRALKTLKPEAAKAFVNLYVGNEV